MQTFFWVSLGFALGSIPFSLLVGKFALHTDIRSLGDGNPGGFNVWKAGGRFWAAFAVLLDGFKGAIPVGLAHYLFGMDGWPLIPVALAPLVGHIFSPILKFNGGKGLATTFGIWLGLTLWLGPTVFGLSLFAWRKVFKTEQRVIAASMLTLMGILVLTGARFELAIICLLNMALLCWTYGKDERVKHESKQETI
jgi:acyl phosphate:glycerol-3-phosphate acyltransferase